MSNVNLTSLVEKNRQTIEEIAQQSRVEFNKCYQCGKCTAGCPVGFAMDSTPRQIMRYLQLNMTDEALKSKAIWMCASCQTCSVRCPREVDIAAVMENVRIMAKKKGYLTEKNMDLFHDIFLKSVEANGRVHELGLILGYNLQSWQPLKDAQYGLPMVTRGKLAIMPHKANDNGEVKKIFANVRKRGGKV